MSERKADKSFKSHKGSGVAGRFQSGRTAGPGFLQGLLNTRDKGQQGPNGERQLNKLKRQELLEILVNQSREIDRLRTELKETQDRLAERNLKIEESGNLAEASLKLYNLFEDAQKAADLYLDNIRQKAGVGEEAGPEDAPDRKEPEREGSAADFTDAEAESEELREEAEEPEKTEEIHETAEAAELADREEFITGDSLTDQDDEAGVSDTAGFSTLEKREPEIVLPEDSEYAEGEDDDGKDR